MKTITWRLLHAVNRKLYKKSLFEKIKKLPFTKQYEVILEKTPHYHRLDAEDKLKLQRSIVFFIHTKMKQSFLRLLRNDFLNHQHH